jgi:hypothetical protein
MIFIQKYRDSEKLDELCRVNATAFRKKIKNRPRFSTIKKVITMRLFQRGFKVICNTISSKYMIVLQSDLLPFYDDCLVANTVVGKLPIFYSKPLEKKS